MFRYIFGDISEVVDVFCFCDDIVCFSEEVGVFDFWDDIENV